jgi:hypothetical protein
LTEIRRADAAWCGGFPQALQKVVSISVEQFIVVEKMAVYLGNLQGSRIPIRALNLR